MSHLKKWFVIIETFQFLNQLSRRQIESTWPHITFRSSLFFLTVSCILQQCCTLRTFREELKWNEMCFDFFYKFYPKLFSIKN